MSASGLLVERELPPEASSASRARSVLRSALTDASAPAGSDRWVESALLAVSEVVTNALVHAGTPMTLRVLVMPSGLRVEVGDGSPHAPVPRDYSPTSGTGRGLKMLERAVDRWGSLPDGHGKVVWFELHAHGTAPPRSGDWTLADSAHGAGREGGGADGGYTADGRSAQSDTVLVELRNVPLLMHSAWQEHASAALREYLLVRSEADDPTIFEAHARASDAMNLLYEQVPAPRLADDPDEVMADAVEPRVSLERLVLRIPPGSVDSFGALEALLDAALSLGEARVLLVPPTQPEIRAMSSWLCQQVRDQHAATGRPAPWSSVTVSLPESAPGPAVDAAILEEVTASESPVLAIDEASVVVAVSPSAADFLGYRSPAHLVGRRVLSIVPARYHQAHIAGTTLHMTNGRSPLLGRTVTVPVVLADGREVPVTLRVDPWRLDSGRRLFVARFSAAASSDPT
jgi:PAS domain S-box-containing protein